eukprot:ctg_1028.g427
MYMVLVLRFGSRRDDDAEAEDDLGVRLGDGISAEAKTGSEPHRRAARAEMAERPTSTSGTAPSSMPWRRYIPTARVPLLIRDIEFQARCYAHFELEPGRKSLCRAMELALVGIPNLLDLRVQPLATLHWMDIPALSGFLRRYLIERVASRFLYPQCARFDFGAAGDAHAEAVPSGHGEGGAANAAQHPAPATRTTPLLLADAAGACRYGGILTVRIVSARGLRAPHSMGDAIDAFVIVYLGSRRKRTRVVRDTASPTWNATFEFFIDDPASAPPVLCCYVFDARLRAVRRSNSEASARAESAFLGSCDVPIGPCLASEQRLDRWLELEEAVAGKLHVTLAFAAFTGGEERFFDAPVRPSTMVAGAAATTSATMPPAPPAPPTALNAAPLRRAPSHGQVSDADLFARAAASSLTTVAAATRPIDREPSLPRSLPATSHAAGTREPTSVDELNAWLAGWLDGTLDTAQPCMNPDAVLALEGVTYPPADDRRRARVLADGHRFVGPVAGDLPAADSADNEGHRLVVADVVHRHRPNVPQPVTRVGEQDLAATRWQMAGHRVADHAQQRVRRVGGTHSQLVQQLRHQTTEPPIRTRPALLSGESSSVNRHWCTISGRYSAGSRPSRLEMKVACSSPLSSWAFEEEASAGAGSRRRRDGGGRLGAASRLAPSSTTMTFPVPTGACCTVRGRLDMDGRSGKTGTAVSEDELSNRSERETEPKAGASAADGHRTITRERRRNTIYQQTTTRTDRQTLPFLSDPPLPGQFIVAAGEILLVKAVQAHVSVLAARRESLAVRRERQAVDGAKVALDGADRLAVRQVQQRGAELAGLAGGGGHFAGLLAAADHRMRQQRRQVYGVERPVERERAHRLHRVRVPQYRGAIRRAGHEELAVLAELEVHRRLAVSLHALHLLAGLHVPLAHGAVLRRRHDKLGGVVPLHRGDGSSVSAQHPHWLRLLLRPLTTGVQGIEVDVGVLAHEFGAGQVQQPAAGRHAHRSHRRPQRPTIQLMTTLHIPQPRGVVCRAGQQSRRVPEHVARPHRARVAVVGATRSPLDAHHNVGRVSLAVLKAGAWDGKHGTGARASVGARHAADAVRTRNGHRSRAIGATSPTGGDTRSHVS